MHTHAIRTLMLFLAASSAAWAAPVIDVGTHYLLPNDVRTISIAVSGGDQVDALNFYVQVADGGASNGGSATTPKITGINITGPGTLFSQSNVGSQPAYLTGSGGLIWDDFTFTQPGVKLNATGTLAYVTIDTTGTHVSDPAYALNVGNVAANYDPPGYNTDFDDVLPTINAGQIFIIALHQSVWNAAHSGNWTDATWTNPLPPFPNSTTQAVLNTPHTVNVVSPQEANSLDISGLGNVAIDSAASLSLTTDATIANGSNLQVNGTLTAQDVTLDGTLTLASGGSAQLANISGTGTLTVGDGLTPSLMTADSIKTSYYSLGAGSRVTINAISGGHQTAAGSLTPVPEPSTIALLIAAAAGIIFYRKKIVAI